MPKNDRADFHIDEQYTLPWFDLPKHESVMCYFAWPIEMHVNMYNTPLIHCVIHFDGEPIVEADYRVDPSFSLNAQARHSLVVAERILRSIYDVDAWQNAVMELHRSLAIATSPNRQVVSEFAMAQRTLYASVTEFVTKMKLEEGDDDDTAE